MNRMERRTRGKEASQPQGTARVRLKGPFGTTGMKAGTTGVKAKRVRAKINRERSNETGKIEETSRELEELEDFEITVRPAELNDDSDGEGELTVVAYMSDTRRFELLSMGAKLFGKTAEEVTAATATTMGKGKVNIWRFKNDGTDDVEDTGRWVYGYHWGDQTIPSGTKVHVAPHLQSARWLIDYEVCG